MGVIWGPVPEAQEAKYVPDAEWNFEKFGNTMIAIAGDTQELHVIEPPAKKRRKTLCLKTLDKRT